MYSTLVYLALLCCACLTSGQHTDQGQTGGELHSGGNEQSRGRDQWSENQRSGDVVVWGVTATPPTHEHTHGAATWAPSADQRTTQRFAYPTQRYYGQYGQYDTYTTQRSPYSNQGYDQYTTRSPYYPSYTQAPYYNQQHSQSQYPQRPQQPQQPSYNQGSYNYNPYPTNSPHVYPYYPSQEPQLRTLVLSHNSIYLWWSDRSGVAPSAPAKYTIRYSPTGQTGVASTKEVSERELLLSDLYPGTQYEFALKVAGASQFGRSVFNRTLDTVPVSAPSHVRIVASESDPTSAVIHLPRESNSGQGQVDSYLILYAPSGTVGGNRERTWQEMTVQGDQTQAVLRNLVPNMEYFYTVQARNRRGFGPFSDTASFTTGGGGYRPQPPYNPYPYTRPQPNYWTTADPYARTRDPYATPYQGYYDPRTTPSYATPYQGYYDPRTTPSWNDRSRDQQTTRPYWHRSDDQNTTPRSNGEDTVSELAPAAPKDLFVMQADAPTEAIVSFTPPDATNGEILSYELRYTHDSSQPESSWTVEDSPDSQISVTFLHPNQQYHFKIRARNAHGFGPYSEVYVYSTDPNVQNPDPGSGTATVGFIPAGEGDGQDVESPTDSSVNIDATDDEGKDAETTQQRR